MEDRRGGMGEDTWRAMATAAKQASGDNLAGCAQIEHTKYHGVIVPFLLLSYSECGKSSHPPGLRPGAFQHFGIRK